jgi:hypothetical protein
MNLPLLSLATLLVAGCVAEPVTPAGSTSDQPEARKAAAAGDDTICTREYPTGSNIPVTKCRSRAQAAAEKAAADEMMRRAHTLGARPSTQPGAPSN